MPDPTLYEVLGLDRSATVQDIDAALREQLRAHHPDRVVDPAAKALAEERVKQLSHTAAILKDPVRRAQYDRQLEGTTRAMPSSGSAIGSSASWSPPAATTRYAPPTIERRRQVAGFAALGLGPACTAFYFLSLQLASTAPTIAWLVSTALFSYAVALASPLLADHAFGRRVHVTLAACLSPIAGVMLLPRLVSRLLGDRVL